MKLGRRIFTIIVAILMFASMELTALADTWYLEQGDVVVNAGDSGQSVSQGTVTKADSAPVITQRDSSVATSNTITVNAENGADANITIQDVNIQASSGAAIETNRSEGSSVTVELEGSNTLVGGSSHAGLETNGTGDLIIQDTDDDGSLKAEGGFGGAAIGGGYEGDGTNITITGGTIEATSGAWSAGIGAGFNGIADNITISGGTVVAEASANGAGIGGGHAANGAESDASNITITGGDVTATGSTAGIGGGNNGADATGILISGGNVTATGTYGSGIGGGNGGDGENITITGGNVTATGSAVGIGGSTGTNITISGGTVEATGATGIGGSNGGTNITINGGTVEATGTGGAGIGGGDASDITINGGTVVAEGSNGAGIGGGYNGDGTNITINDGDVTAIGKGHGAGIGGGSEGNGTDIIISGGKVNAQGGNLSAAIGGGKGGQGSNLVVKNNAVVVALGNDKAADSGNGYLGKNVQQQDNINLDDLYTTGSYTNRYGTVYGTKVPPVPKVEWPHLCSRYGAQIRQGNLYCRCGEMLLKLYEVNCPWVEKLENGVLSITVEESDAILIYWLFGIQALVEQDVHTLVFETEQAKTVLELEDWLAENTADGEYQICHTGQETRILQTQ